MVGIPAVVGYVATRLFGIDSFLLSGGVAASAIVAGIALLIVGGARWKIPQMAELRHLLSHRLIQGGRE
jgi:hypothetical protein